MKKNLFAILCFGFAFNVSCFAQDFKWAIQAGGDAEFSGTAADISFATTAYDVNFNVLTDGFGSVYNMGVYDYNTSDTVDFDPGPGFYGPAQATQQTGFIQKIDSTGNLTWFKSLIGEQVTLYSADFDVAGNVVLTGTFVDTLDADPGPGNYPLISTGVKGIYFIKLSAAGNLVWAKHISCTNHIENRSFSLDVNTSDEIIISGKFTDSIDIDPGPGVNMLTAVNVEMFLLALDGSGNYLWHKEFLPTLTASKMSYVVTRTDAGGNIFLGGTYSGQWDFDPGAGVYGLGALATSVFNGFIMKMDNAANFIWAERFECNSMAAVNDFIIEQTGNLVIAGNFMSTLDVDPGPGVTTVNSAGGSDAFVIKLHGSGYLLWYKTFGGSSYDLAAALAMDSNNDYYVAGAYFGTVDLDPGPIVNNMVSSATSMFVQKYNASGTILSVYAHESELGSSTLEPEAIAIYNQDIYIAGPFDPISVGTTDFDPDTSSFMIYSNSPAFSAYLEKLQQNACSAFKVSIDSVANVTCYQDGYGSAYGLYGTMPYTYSWNTTPIDTDSVTLFTSGGIYMVTATDSMGCVDMASCFVSAPPGNPIDFQLYAGYLPVVRIIGDNTVYIAAYNQSCDSSVSYISYVHDSIVTPVSFSIPPDAVFGDSLVWNVPLLNYDNYYFGVYIETDPTMYASVGAESVRKVYITTAAADVDLSNNFQIDTLPVVTSYDPNIKSVLPAGACSQHYVTNTQRMQYTIHFQNTGNAPALNIYVLDTLDTDLDISTLQIMVSSHYMVTEVLPGNVLKFRFDDIYLDDSATNEPGSHGFVVYEINQQPGLSNGTLLENEAYIYFDYNPYILTNSVFNTVIDVIPACAVDVPEYASEGPVNIYPNPTNNSITIQTDKIADKILVTDVYGRVVKTLEPKAATTQVDLSNFEGGIYFVNVLVKELKQTIKVIKQ